MLEVMAAVVMLIVGAVGVAQLIPYSLQMNSGNRWDSTGLVLGQRELEQFMQQPLTVTQFTDAEGNVCNLGSNTTFYSLQGSPTVVTNGRTMIDFSQPQVANYSFNYKDPADPTNSWYDVRWAVSTTGTAAGNIMSRHIVMSVRKGGTSGYILPATLDVVVSK